MKRILIIDDDMDMCNLLSRFLTRKGFETATAFTGAKGLAKFREDNFDVVLCDFRLGDMDGRQALGEFKKINPSAVVIIITGYSDIKMAVDVMRQGAFDYITKPLIPEEVVNVINKGLSAEQAMPSPASYPGNQQQGPASGKRISTSDNGEFMTGISPKTQALNQQIDLVAPTNYSVILYGESGTGKEVMARAIHQRSNRHDKPFIAVDCGTLSRELAGSELFGHVKGSFTGALTDKEGIFEIANGGTLFLDEVANLPLDVQATLLRVIQERKYKKVGGNKDLTTDVRVLVASNENLQEAYREGKFREDLYHRFNEFSISIPPLRERKEDIILFAEFFLAKVNAELNKNLEGFEEEVLQLFSSYNWPGNLREFRNVIRRAGLLTTAGKINSNVLPWEIIGGLQHHQFLPQAMPAAAPAPPPTLTEMGGLKGASLQAEYETIMNVLKEVKYNKSKAAAKLSIDRKTLYNKIKAFEDSRAAI
jgi:two-component system, NtrC family, response regulator HydG